MNEKGQRLLDICCHHGLCITNSYFKCKELHKVSWLLTWCIEVDSSKILQKIGCPSKLLATITSFHQDMQRMVCIDGATSNAFPVSSGVKRGCVLAPTLLGIFFSMLLPYAFVDCTEGVYNRTTSDGKLFNITRLHQNQSLCGAHTGAAVCRRHCFNIPQQGGPPIIW